MHRHVVVVFVFVTIMIIAVAIGVAVVAMLWDVDAGELACLSAGTEFNLCLLDTVRAAVTQHQHLSFSTIRFICSIFYLEGGSLLFSSRFYPWENPGRSWCPQLHGVEGCGLWGAP